ncbi:NAD(P)/FAD-dependent oxidoreductase [Lignipirellula cremea]|uniref:NADH:ubiquinone reductase (non-electrogenic) n=1 Tax=Lignipirellula cremea TaxID=2528010 RepID=A0A518E202_9BACT|nr:NAD(P)/FAD-dependent oxidoreductase [Lignipirellula cremea]QDU98118.1 NADH dehydrogenase-like protein [Lignipirellula cremea]
MEQHRVVIIGGGFGGLAVAKGLRDPAIAGTLIDRRNFHLFQPLLYQVATGGLSPANISAPLRSVLRRQKNVQVLLAKVVGIDTAAGQVQLEQGVLPFDTLIVAAGMRHHYFGHDDWARLAPGLKTIEEATEIRRRVLSAFEQAERETDPAAVRRWLTFVVIGGGPTGVELSGAIAELSRHTLRGNFRSIDPASAHVVLIEGNDRVLPPFPPKLSQKAQQSLERLGVEVRCGVRVTSIEADRVHLSHNAGSDQIATPNVFWAAGVQASPLGAAVAAATGAKLDRSGRVQVQPDCSIAGHPHIFVIGDLAALNDEHGQPLPGLAPVATQQGQYLARLLQRRLHGKETPPFRYVDRGSMATIGRASAVAQTGKLHFSGFLAWLAWLFIHVYFLIDFQNRMLVLFQWGWNYFTRNRSARLITGVDGMPPLLPQPADVTACDFPIPTAEQTAGKASDK